MPLTHIVFQNDFSMVGDNRWSGRGQKINPSPHTEMLPDAL